jgi:hypothetical protein
MRIAHQMAHHFIEAAVPHAPPWFEEGFAQYLSFVYLLQHGDTTIACFGHPQAAMSASVVSIPVRDLFAYEWRRFNDEGDDHWFMFTSRAFIDYLLHGEDGKLRHRFGRFMHGLAEGKGGAEAFAAAYPDLSIDTVDQRLNAHVRTHRPPAELCPVGFAIARPRNTQPARIPVGANEVRVLFERLEQVPFKEGNADFYPVDLISGSSSDPHARS